jgi:hypothetical protein
MLARVATTILEEVDSCLSSLFVSIRFVCCCGKGAEKVTRGGAEIKKRGCDSCSTAPFALTFSLTYRQSSAT